MRSYTLVLLLVLATSASVTFASPTDGEICDQDLAPKNVVTYRDFVGRQKSVRDEDAVSFSNQEHRAAYFMSRHRQAFARLRDEFTDEQIESAYALFESLRGHTHFTYWVNYSYLPEQTHANDREYLFPLFAKYLGPEFVSSGNDHYAPNAELMELTVALTDGHLGSTRLVEAVPSGKRGAEVLNTVFADKQARARELHRSALTSVLAKYSEGEIEAAFKVLSEDMPEDARASWISYCYLKGTPGPQRVRRARSTFAANPGMIELTLALTNPDLNHLALVSVLPSGKTALEVLQGPRALKASRLSIFKSILSLFRR